MRKERIKAKVADLILNEGQLGWLPTNPRQWTQSDIDKTKESLERDPDFQEDNPLKVVGCDGKLLVFAGNLRTTAAKSLRWKTFEAILYTPETDEDKETIKRRSILDNGAFGSWDYDMLANEWDDLPLADWGVPAWETENIADSLTPKEVEEDDFDESKDHIEVRCKRGDIWQLGEHRLMCGDSVSLDDVKKLMGGNEADITFSSPPYNAQENLGGNTHMKDSRYLEKDDLSLYVDLLNGYLSNSLKFSQYTFMNIQMLANNKRDVIECLSRFKDNFADAIIWNKGQGSPAMAKNVLNACFEFIFVFAKEKKASRAINSGEDFRGTLKNVYDGPPQRNNEFSEVHAATFPIHLPSYFIEHFSKESVLDLFGGTGTTMIAAEQLGRKSYLMEIDPRYCDVIIARWEKFTGKQATKIN